MTHDGDGTQPGETQALGWQALLDLGHAEAQLDPGAFERGWRQVTPDTLATLIYTSGTTGRPKAVMITHRNVRYGQQATLRVIPLADQVGPDGTATLVSYLPMAHVTGRTVDHWGPLAHPVTLAYCPDQLRLFEVAAQARPTALIGIPRVWEKLHAALRAVLPTVDPKTVRALPDAAKQTVLTRIGLGPLPDRDDRRGADRPGDRRVLPRARRAADRGLGDERAVQRRDARRAGGGPHRRGRPGVPRDGGAPSPTTARSWSAARW